MQECGRRQTGIDDDVIGKTDVQCRYSPSQQTLSGRIFTVAGTVWLDIEGQSNTCSDDADHGQRMPVADDLLRGVAVWAAQITALFPAPPYRGAVQRQPNKRRRFERLVAF